MDAVSRPVLVAVAQENDLMKRVSFVSFQEAQAVMADKAWRPQLELLLTSHLQGRRELAWC